MATNPVILLAMTSSTAAAESLSGPALERALDQLAERVRADVEALEFLSNVLRLLVQTARAHRAAVWLRDGEQCWTRLGLSAIAVDGAVESTTGVTARDWLNAALTQAAPAVTRFSEDDQAVVRLTASIRQGGQPAGVLEAVWDATAPVSTLLPFVGAVGELTGDFLVQHELRILRRQRLEWNQWERFQASLAEAKDLRQLAMVLAQDGRAVAGADRLTIVRIRLGRSYVEAVSGVDVIDPRSSTVQALERLATAIAADGRPQWDLSEHPQTPSIQAAFETLRQVAQCRTIGVLPVPDADGRTSGVLIAERFVDAKDAAIWRQRCETLQRFGAPLWSAMIERHLTAWERWTRHRTAWATTSRKLLIAALVLVGVLIALAVIPVEHIVTAEGELLPDRRRDIFASTSGIVSDLRVAHGDDVAEGQTLAVLRDPQVELEATRVVGELATVRTRLGVVQAARVAAMTSAEAPLRAQQLTAEEEELKQRLESLTRQQSLLDEQRTSWELKSPIAGQVLTWDLESRLTGRPVERGQVLMTVGDVAGEWIIEARIRERDIGPVWAAAQARTPVSVDFVTTIDTHTVQHGTVRELARTAEIDERGETTLLVTIAVEAAPSASPRPGATVLPRIRCGRKSLGEVWLKPLFDALRRQWWQW